MASFDWRETRVFHGEITSQAAKVYAQLPAEMLTADMALRGEVVGPFCSQARTLPANTSLQYLGADPAPLAAGHITDPSIWLPDLPSLYHVKLWIERRGSNVDQTELTLGLRRFAAQGRSFLENSRRIVLRGGPPSDETRRDAASWRDAMLHQVVHESHADLDDHLLWADRTGVTLAVVVSATDQVPATLRRLSGHPSVSLALATGDLVERLGNDDGLFREACNSKGRLALAAVIDRPALKEWMESTTATSAWRLLFSATAHHDDDAWPTAQWPQIVIGKPEGSSAVREWNDPVIGLRRTCELLQRDNAKRGDFAGYLACESLV